MKFQIWTDSYQFEGIAGLKATVEMDLTESFDTEEEEINYIKGQLRHMFSVLWGYSEKEVHIVVLES